MVKRLKRFNLVLERIDLFMGLCLQCSKWIKQPEGKRAKLFCNNTCRSNFWYSKNKKTDNNPKIKDLNRATNVLKPQEQPRTNYSINTTPEPKMSFLDTPESFLNELQSATTSDQLESIGRRIDKSNFSWSIKQRLQNIGRQIYNEKFNF